MSKHHRVVAWALATFVGTVACAPFQVPMLARPDTRFVLGAEMESSIVRVVAETFRDSLPNETGVCLAVALRDSAVAGVPHPLYIARVTGSAPAAIARANPFAVEYDSTVVSNGCPSTRQFARAHSHPYSEPPFLCTHSDQDAIFLASDPRLLFSVILCGDGRGEALWQDGRRVAFTWLRPSEAP